VLSLNTFKNMEKEKKEVDETTNQSVQTEETNDNTSKLDETSLKTTEELEKELIKAKETLKKAEHTIVQLKKEKISIDIDAIKKDVANEIKEELKPTLDSVKSFAQLKKENEELKEVINSKKSQTGSAEGHSIKTDNSKPVPTDTDVRLANKFFNGDIERYMKYKK
jgi:signal transduction protein with GAF and PtsI domain